MALIKHRFPRLAQGQLADRMVAIYGRVTQWVNDEEDGDAAISRVGGVAVTGSRGGADTRPAQGANESRDAAAAGVAVGVGGVGVGTGWRGVRERTVRELLHWCARLDATCANTSRGMRCTQQQQQQQDESNKQGEAQPEEAAKEEGARSVALSERTVHSMLAHAFDVFLLALRHLPRRIHMAHMLGMLLLSPTPSYL